MYCTQWIDMSLRKQHVMSPIARVYARGCVQSCMFLFEVCWSENTYDFWIVAVYSYNLRYDAHAASELHPELLLWRVVSIVLAELILSGFQSSEHADFWYGAVCYAWGCEHMCMKVHCVNTHVHFKVDEVCYHACISSLLTCPVSRPCSHFPRLLLIRTRSILCIVCACCWCMCWAFSGWASCSVA